MMKIIGIGSPFGDDQFGLEVANLLLSQTLAHVTIESLDRPGLQLLEAMQGFDKVIIVDAIYSQAPVGTLHQLSVADIQSLEAPMSSHGFGLAETLRMGKVLNQLPEALMVYGVTVNPKHPGPKLSDKVAEAVPLVIERLLDSI